MFCAQSLRKSGYVCAEIAHAAATVPRATGQKKAGGAPTMRTARRFQSSNP